MNRPARPVEGQTSEAVEAAEPSYHYLVSTDTAAINPEYLRSAGDDTFLVSVHIDQYGCASLDVSEFATLSDFETTIELAESVLHASTYREGCIDLVVDRIHTHAEQLVPLMTVILPTAIRLAYEARMRVEGYDDGFYGLSTDVALLERDVQVVDVTARVAEVLR